MDIGVGVDTTNDSVGVFYDGHCHPSLHRRAGVARTCRTGGPGRRTLVSTGPEHRSSIRPVSAVPETSRRVIRRTTSRGVSRFASQTSLGNKPTVRTGPRVTALTKRSAHPNTSSLPDTGRAISKPAHWSTVCYVFGSSARLRENLGFSCQFDCLFSIIGAEFGEDGGHVILHRAYREEQPVGDFLVGEFLVE
jgi:hypothetical protein